MLMLLAVIAGQPVASQQTDSQNYVITRSYKQSGAPQDNVSQVDIQVKYSDGLGRPVQTVSVGKSPAGTDYVEALGYDAAGRPSAAWLPYAATGSGSYRSNATTAVATWYTGNSAGLESSDLARPLTETFYEQSPLGRPTGSRAPGNKSATATVTYKANAANEVRRYDYNPSGNAIAANGYYTAGKLEHRLYTDEQGHVSSEFIDPALGLLICRKVDTGSESLDTYYVYDDMKLLRGVLQPEYQTTATDDNAFRYDYDNQGNLISKKIPGAGATEIVYDRYFRPAMSRDANQAARGVWGFTKYDALNRPVVTGEISSSSDRATWAGTVAGITNHHETRNNGVTEGYSLNQTAPTSATEANLLTITFYDDHAFQKPSDLNYVTLSGYPSVNTAVKGQVTGGRSRVLPGNGSAGGWLTYATYYDAEYRPIQTVRQLYELGTSPIERVSTRYKYDLAAVVDQQTSQQVLSGSVTNNHTATFVYDHADRLLRIHEQVTTPSTSKAAYTVAQRYNTLGMLSQKWFHGYASDAAQYRRRTDYTYNIRSWLTEGKTSYKQYSENPDLPFYAFELAYAKGSNYTNGNISQMRWKEKDVYTYTTGLSFSYDGANRLTGSTGLGGYSDTESGIIYDKNGNIKTLSRTGVAVDNLTYIYTGNLLSSVTDGSGNNSGIKSGTSAYNHDANGNLISDGNRGAAITYNYLNLPRTVAVGGKTFTYDYDASGAKHRYYGDTVNIKYAGTFEYNGSNVLKRVGTADGQVVPKNDTLAFHYYLRDHLGNVRVVFDETGEIIQETGYYPFGLETPRDGKSEAVRNGTNRYLYNQKESQIGSGYLDYGARMYDPGLGRWLGSDPLADSLRRFSPFAYGFNNPIRFIDPDGRMGDDPQKSWLEQIIDYFGFFKQFESREEAASYAGRQERFNSAAAQLTERAEELRETVAYIPLLGAATEISHAAIAEKDNTKVLASTLLFGLEAVPGGSAGKKGAQGVYDLGTTLGKYIGQSKDIPKRIGQHLAKGGKLFQGELQNAVFHSMPGSTKLQREVYEQYLVTKHGGPNSLLNQVNPMGGRMDVYHSMINDVIKQFNLPK